MKAPTVHMRQRGPGRNQWLKRGVCGADLYDGDRAAIYWTRVKCEKCLSLRDPVLPEEDPVHKQARGRGDDHRTYSDAAYCGKILDDTTKKARSWRDVTCQMCWENKPKG